MKIEDFELEFDVVAGAMPVLRSEVTTEQWRAACGRARNQGGRIVALWGSDKRDRGQRYAVHAALAVRTGLVILTLPLEHEFYPGISELFPAANRMQRALYDLLGLKALDAQDQRQWLRHAAWPDQVFPLRKDFSINSSYPTGKDDYPFVKVQGEGVHEIPVGPVHAGTIEPGHFRFSIVGERVLRLEERLEYKHKGIEKLFETMSLAQGAKLAGRVSGDSTVAYAWAYAMAVESASGITISPRAAWLRALFLERERIANHLGDLGFLGNDAGLAFGLAQFSRLKEEVLRANLILFGHRYLMDAIIPGGVSINLDMSGASVLHQEIEGLTKSVSLLKNIYDEHAGLQDRFIGAGRVTPETAARLGLCGLAGRASGQAWDLRAQFPTPPYDELNLSMVTHRNGDVAARVIVRFEELIESLRLCARILESLPDGEIVTQLQTASEHAVGYGWVEGWRGEVLVALEVGKNNSIQRLHPHDPSWQNWPLLEHAVIDNIVPDFPLINKSFNLSYSGHDL